MIYFITFKGSTKETGSSICECCAAYLENVAVSKELKHTTYYRKPISNINSMQTIPSKGIVVSDELGDIEALTDGDVLDVVNLGGDDNLYIRSSIEEYPFD